MAEEKLETLRLQSSIDDISKPSLWRGALAELLATMLFLFIGCSSTLSGNHVIIALCFGLGIASLVWIFGDVSGGHINPAVTLSMLVTRRITLVRAVFYIIAQIVGSILGVLILRHSIFANKVPNGFCLNAPKVGLTDAQAMGVELMATSVLVFTIFAACDNVRKLSGSGALSIGLAVSLGHFAFIPITGASMNPARSFGPAVMEHNFHRHWIYWVGPFLGAIIAGLLYEIIFAGASNVERVRHMLMTRDYDPEKIFINSEHLPLLASRDRED